MAKNNSVPGDPGSVRRRGTRYDNNHAHGRADDDHRGLFYQQRFDLNFGSSGVIAANVDQTPTVQVQCTNTTPYNIRLDAGTGSGATVAAGKMTNGAARITYSRP